jgi:serine/threonine protein kinase
METFHTVDPAAVRPGTEVGSWRVVRRHAQGSYGVVYLAEPVGPQAQGPVALKLALHAGDERFEREVELLSRLRHPHVPRLRDSGVWTSPEGAALPYLVMDWCEGVPLYQWAARPGFSSRDAFKVLAQVARAVAATHEVEGVHRDIKGDNVLVAKGGHAVLLDFGSGAFRGARVLTRPRVPVGTPQYWSPEAQLFQWRFGRRATARYEAGPADDVYALGVMAYRLVTGEYPPDALIWETEGDMPRPASAERVRPEALVTVSPELAALIRQMLSEKPTARGTAAEVAQAFEHAEKAAGRKANRPITKVRARTSAVRTVRPESLRSVVAWLGWITAAVMSVALVFSASGTDSRHLEARPAQVAQGTSGRDRETAALGDEVLAARGEAEMRESERNSLGLEMPKKPLPGQRRPPCKKPEVEINGGCWGRLGDASPPCGDNSYEWNTGCYLPFFIPGRPTTSEGQ